MPGELGGPGERGTLEGLACNFLCHFVWAEAWAAPSPPAEGIPGMTGRNGFWEGGFATSIDEGTSYSASSNMSKNMSDDENECLCEREYDKSERLLGIAPEGRLFLWVLSVKIQRVFLLLNSAHVMAVAIATFRLSMLRVLRYDGMNNLLFTFFIICGDIPFPSFPMMIMPVFVSFCS